MKITKRVVPSMLAVAVAALSSTQANAQDQVGNIENSQNAEDQSGINVITVTARRREENLQDTPISITAFGGEALEERQIADVGKIADLTPNLTINTTSAFSGSSSTPSIFLRGIGQVDFTLNTDPGVGLYVDGVYISRSVGALIDLVDIERVEVLRGPQGTLFGRNTIGGAVNVTTNKPSNEFEGRLKLTTGTDDRIQVQGLVNIPLTNTLSSRFAVNYHKRDGYVFRPNVGDRLGDDDSFSARGTLFFEPSDNFRATLNGDVTIEREASPGFILTGLDANAPFPGFFNAVVAPMIDPTLAFPLGPMGPPSACFIGASNPACFNEQSVSVGVPGINDGTGQSESRVDVFGISLTAEYDVSDAITIKSITAYRDLESFGVNEADAAPVAVNLTTDVFVYNQFSQELQLLGESGNGRLNWILGAYYFEESGTFENGVFFPVIILDSNGQVDNSSLAFFGQATWEPLDGLFLTGGLRWTEDQRDFLPMQTVAQDIATGIPTGTPLLPMVTATTSTSRFTPYANIRYQFSPDVSAYFTYSRGFKSGGFTQRVFPPLFPAPGQDPAEVIPSFAPESVDSFEIGVKSLLLDNAVQLNAAAFRTDYTDLQVNVQLGIAPTTQNAAEATIEGAELELIIQPADVFQFNAGLGYIDARYDRLDASVIGITLDSQLPGTSEWTINAGATLTQEIDGIGIFKLRGDVSHRSEFFFDASNEVGEDGYVVVNVGLTWESFDGQWEASIFGSNITDELYAIAGASILDPGGFQQTLFARGAEWGASIGFRF